MLAVRAILLGLGCCAAAALAQRDTMPDGAGFNQPVIGVDGRAYPDAAAAAAAETDVSVPTREDAKPTHYHWDPYYVPRAGPMLPSSSQGDHEYSPADTHMPERATSTAVTDKATAAGAITGEAVRGGAVTGRAVRPEL